jgi:FAD/FMN-containing dehydrogenase
VSLEYDNEAPELSSLGIDINPWKVSHCQDESIEAYLLRHNSRFHAMRLAGQWELQHPWYECLVPQEVMLEELDELLRSLPLYYATVVHLVPIARRQPAGFFMSPDKPEFFSVMILNPGVPPALLPGCLEAITMMDKRFLARGGKRYLSGYLGDDLSPDYWKTHFGPEYETWLNLKKQYDPNGIFCSSLFNSI